jgi:hypothetical protein
VLSGGLGGHSCGAGGWQGGATLVADAKGGIALPPFPGDKDRSDDDWALKPKLNPEP